MNTLSFDQDTDGNWGYKVAGADTVTPFKKAGSGGDDYPDTITIRTINWGGEGATTRTSGSINCICFVPSVYKTCKLTLVQTPANRSDTNVYYTYGGTQSQFTNGQTITLPAYTNGVFQFWTSSGTSSTGGLNGSDVTLVFSK